MRNVLAGRLWSVAQVRQYVWRDGKRVGRLYPLSHWRSNWEGYSTLSWVTWGLARSDYGEDKPWRCVCGT